MGLQVPLTKNHNCKKTRLILELKIDKKILICDMACPQQNNIGAKRAEKTTNCRQIAFETRELHPGYEVYLVPVAVGDLDGSIKALRLLEKVF